MKHLIGLALIGALLILSSGCTPYQKSGLSGGYDEIWLGENIVKIQFRGNGYTSMERAVNFTLLRSADITLEHGYSFFSIMDEKQNVSHHTTYTPTTIRATGYGNYRVQGGQPIHISKPSAINTIIMFRTKPKDIFSYDAAFVRHSIRTTYKLNDSLKKQWKEDISNKLKMPTT